MYTTVKLLASLASTVILSFPSVAFAQSGYPGRYYGIARNGTQQIQGGKFVATINSLNSAWSSTSSQRFINHTMWLPLDAAVWIETGFTDGTFRDPDEASSSYYKGFYTSRGSLDSNGNLFGYVEEKIIGPSTANNTTHTFTLQKGSATSTWLVYINGVQRLTWLAVGNAQGMDVGIETNTANSTSAPWNERNFQVYQNGVWSSWGSGSFPVSPTVGISVAWDVYPTSIRTSKVIP